MAVDLASSNCKVACPFRLVALPASAHGHTQSKDALHIMPKADQRSLAHISPVAAPETGLQQSRPTETLLPH